MDLGRVGGRAEQLHSTTGRTRRRCGLWTHWTIDPIRMGELLPGVHQEVIDRASRV
jgi:hypothetical protein